MTAERLHIRSGEGGFCVWGKQTPAAISLQQGLLPLGLAHEVKLKHDIPEGGALRWDDVEIDETHTAVKIRREMEAAFGGSNLRSPQTDLRRDSSASGSFVGGAGLGWRSVCAYRAITALAM